MDGRAKTPDVGREDATPPDVSVIVVVRNGMAFLDRCLQSLLGQTGVRFEVIVVDNASTDGTLEHVRAEYARVRVVASDRNLGYAGGFNAGLEVARGTFVAGLNVDTEMAPGCLFHLWKVLADSLSTGVVTPLLVIDQDRERINAMGGAIHVSGLSFCHGLGEPRSRAPSAPFPVPGFSGACFMLRRSLADRLGGAPAHCFMGNDDVVMSWWVRLAGLEVVCVPAAVVYHHYGLSLGPDKLFLVERNRLDLLLSTLRKRTLLLLAPALLSIEAAILVYCAARGSEQLEAKLAAYRAAWAWRRERAGRRRRVQGLRAVSDLALLSRFRLVPEWRQLRHLLQRDAKR